MENNVLIATALNGHARIHLFNSKQMVETARTTHDLWPTSCAALGRTLSVSALMGQMQKGENEEVVVTINGGGPIGTILCIAQGDGTVRGFCGDPHIYETYPDTGKLAVGKAVGTDGYLKVTRNLKLKQSYTSQTKLVSGEIGNDFAYYFSVSEQVPTIVSVGVLVDTDDSVRSAGAMIIELMPDHDESDIEYLEQLKLEPISSVLDRDPYIHHYLYELFPEAQILEEKTISYHCGCSKERFLQKLRALPVKDLEELAEEKELEIRCEFCEKIYHISQKEIQGLLGHVEDQG